MYTISQIFVVLGYLLLGVSYCLKSRKTILIVSLASLVSSYFAYLFLNAYSGMAMMILAIIRNLIFIGENKKNNSDKISYKDWLILVFLYIVTIIFAFFTYKGIGSMISIVASMVYTYSVWQKKENLYKILGIPASILWIMYNVYIKSIFGIILEFALLIFEIINVIRIKKEFSYITKTLS